jgi:pimeloyl-ACP methyl ester carboxylesterase
VPVTHAINSTNVRNAISFAWHRLHLRVASTLAPQRAVERAARLFTTPPRFAHTAAERAVLATGTRFDILVDGLRLAAWRFGAAERVVVLCHGWGGRGAQLRAFVPALVEAGYGVVLFDHVGHGLSEGRHATLVHFVRDLAAVVRHVESRGRGIDFHGAGLTAEPRVVAIVGHSLGAAAAAAWLNDTGRALRTVLVAPPTSLERYSAFFARRLGISEPVRRAMQERFERALGKRWREFELPQSVARVKAQGLVVHDAGDRDVAPSSGLALARAWPGARFLGTHGLGHRAILRDAGVVRDAVDFIDARVQFAPPPARGERLPYGAPAPLV